MISEDLQELIEEIDIIYKAKGSINEKEIAEFINAYPQLSKDEIINLCKQQNDTTTSIQKDRSIPAVKKDEPSKNYLLQREEVKELKYIALNKSVTLSWKLPENAVNVQIWKWEAGAAVIEKKAELLAGITPWGVIDSAVKNNKTYRYLIAVNYHYEGNKILTTKGIEIEVTPKEPPEAVQNIQLKKNDNGFDISFTPPDMGIVKMFYSHEPLKYKAGTIIDIEMLKEEIFEVSCEQTTCTLITEAQGMFYFMPVTFEDSMAVTGTIVSDMLLRPLTAITGEIKYDSLYLQWRWPVGIEKVLVTYKYDGFPQGPYDNTAIHQVYFKSQYDREGGFAINKAGDRSFYFTIYVMVETSDKVVYSEGVSRLIANTAVKDIYYDIKVTKGLLGKIKAVELVIKCNEKDIDLPEMIIVKRKGNLPLRKSDGTVVCKFEPVHIEGKESININIPLDEMEKNSYIKLFITDDNRSKTFRLISPGTEKLLIN